jgi:hypothetical protein
MFCTREILRSNWTKMGHDNKKAYNSVKGQLRYNVFIGIGVGPNIKLVTRIKILSRSMCDYRRGVEW